MNFATLGLWWRCSLLALAILFLSLVYGYVPQTTFTFAHVSDALAFTGGVLIGASFGLSGITYFFDFWDSKLKYRKQLGLLGYYFALAHSITLLVRFPQYVAEFPHSWLTIDAILGLTAMFILTLMALVSTQKGMSMLGTHWRPVLRLGYLAYGLLILRAYYLMHDSWLNWILAPESLPPARLLLTLYALAVIILRLMMEIGLRIEKHT